MTAHLYATYTETYMPPQASAGATSGAQADGRGGDEQQEWA